MWAGARSDRQLTQPSQSASIHPIRGGSVPAGADQPGAGPAHVFRRVSHHLLRSFLALHRPRQAPILLLPCRSGRRALAPRCLPATHALPLLPAPSYSPTPSALPRDGEVVVVVGPQGQRGEVVRVEKETAGQDRWILMSSWAGR